MINNIANILFFTAANSRSGDVICERLKQGHDTGWAKKNKPDNFCKSDVSAVQGHQRSLIFGTNRKRLCDSLLAVIVTLVLLLCFTVSEILQVFCPPNSTSIPPFLGVLPLDRIAHVGVNVSRYLKLFGRDRRTDRRPVLGMILLNCIMIMILIPYRNMYHDTDT